MSSSSFPLTLVAYYGTKPPELASLIDACQKALGSSLGGAYQPYAMEQVHGTIIGLEANRSGDTWINVNFLEHRGETREMDFAKMIEFVRNRAGWPLELRLCGFRNDAEYGFRSREQHPYERSFCIQGEIAVAMGWPVTSEGYSMHLDAIRHRFQGIGALHKWHQDHEDIDNDFYFVLGRVAASVTEEVKDKTTRELRELMAAHEVLNLSIGADDLSLVRYEDTQLPLESSMALSVNAPLEQLLRLTD